MIRNILSVLLCLGVLIGSFPFASKAVEQNPFNDVSSSDWFYKEVLYVYQAGLMNGTAIAEFQPNSLVTRGMLVTILYRMENSPTVSENCPFLDVETNMYYSQAVIWAASHGVVNGYSADNFAPNEPITREQFATILFRFASFKGFDTQGRSDLSQYTDYKNISSYAEESISWAVATGLIQGVGDNLLLPKGNTTRGQTAAILMRFCQKFEETSQDTSIQISESTSNQTESSTSDSSKDEPNQSSENDTEISVDAKKNPDVGDAKDASSSLDMSSENLFKLSTSEIADDGKTVVLTVELGGKVNLCGFDMMLKYNKGLFSLREVNTEHDLDVYSSEDKENGQLSFNFAGATNITKEKIILTATFDVIGNVGETGVFVLSPNEIIAVAENDNLDIIGAPYTMTYLSVQIK